MASSDCWYTIRPTPFLNLKALFERKFNWNWRHLSTNHKALYVWNHIWNWRNLCTKHYYVFTKRCMYGTEFETEGYKIWRKIKRSVFELRREYLQIWRKIWRSDFKMCRIMELFFNRIFEKDHLLFFTTLKIQECQVVTQETDVLTTQMFATSKNTDIELTGFPIFGGL